MTTEAYSEPAYFVGYRFERDAGIGVSYLDFMFLDRMTTDRNRAWIGPLTQVKAVRRKYPWTKTLRLVRNAPPNNVNRS